jgi:hypothetical protein
MPGGRKILKDLKIPFLSRVILRTLDGQVIVRPKAPSKLTLVDADGKSRVLTVLTDEGRAAWDRGEDIDLHLGHILAMGDVSRLCQYEF